MEYKFIDDGSTVVLSGTLTFTDHPVFRVMANQLFGSKLSGLVVNLKNLEFIDSAGLGMLLIARDEALKGNRQLVLKSAGGQVKRMFDISKFDTLFKVES